MATLEELIVEISADTKGVSKAVEKGGKSLDGFSKTLKGVAGVIATTFAVDKIVDFGKSLITAASDAEELQNKYSVVFQGITEETDAWVENYSNAVGRSQQATKGFLADQQDILTGLGLSTEEAAGLSKEVVSLGVDLASFQNLTDEDALARLGSALRGSSEAAAGFGADISVATLQQSDYFKSLGKTFQELTQVEKIQLRLNVIQSQSTNAIGDAERSSEGFANQLKRLQGTLADGRAELGAKFLPIATKFLKFINETIPKLSTFRDSVFDTFSNVFESIQEPLQSVIDLFFRIQEGFEGGFVAGIQNAVGEFQTLGETLLVTAVGFIEPLLSKLGEILPKFIESIVANIPQVLENFISLRVRIITTILKALPDIIDAGVEILKALIKGIADQLPALVKTAEKLIKQLVETVAELLPDIIESGVDILLSLIDGILEVLPDLIKAILDVITVLIRVVTENLPTILEAGIEILLALIDGIVEALPELIEAIVELFPVILDAIVDNLPLIIDAGIQILLALIDGIFQVTEKLGEAIIELFPVVLDALAELIPQVLAAAKEIGLSIVDGIVDGVTGLGDILKEKLVEGTTNAVDAVKDLLGINSPSKLFQEIGGFVTEGFAKGISDQNRMVEMAGTGIATSAVDSTVEGVEREVSNTTSNRTVNIETINVFGQEDINETSNQLKVLQDDTDRSSGFIPIPGV